MGAFILLAFILVVYFVPSFVANKKKNFAAIFALNIFLGWTLVGWVVALCWALASPQVLSADSDIDHGDPDAIRINVAYRDRAAEKSWFNIRIGDPVRLNFENERWAAETEFGPLGPVPPEEAKRLTFRAETLGKPVARVVSIRREPEQIALISVTFPESKNAQIAAKRA